MKTTVIFILYVFSLLFSSNILSAQTSKQKVAVYMTGNNVNAGYKKVIGSKMVSEIAKSKKYIAIERTADFLAALNAETDYQTSGAVSDNQIIKIGQQFGVSYVSVVELTEVFDQLFVSARLINVQTGEIVKSAEVSGPAESMQQLTELGKKISEDLVGANTVDFSTSPINYGLAVRNTNGLRFYISQEQYYAIDGKLPDGFIKEGVYTSGYNGYINSSVAIIVPLFDSYNGTANWQFAMSHYPNLPTKDQAFLLSSKSMDEALRLFGGKALNGVYWTQTSDMQLPSSACIILCGVSSAASNDKSNNYKIREVITVR